MQVRTITAGLGGVGIALLSLLGAGASSAGGSPYDQRASSARHTVYLLDCRGDRAKIEPKVVVLACGDGGAIVERASWKQWGGAKATATATLAENNCDPSCYQGTFVTEPATMTVSSIVRRDGRYRYGHIRVVPHAPNRHHFRVYSGPLPG